jgi:uroporphyrinogen-III synthase
VNTLPLAGRRVLVTRALHQAGRFSKQLRELGAESVEVPVLEIAPPESYARLDEAITHFDWLILTSSNALQQLCARCARFGVNPARAEGLSIAAVGTATAEAARHYGFHVHVIPDTYVAESLVESLRNRVAGKRLLLARAAVARDVIPDALRAAGAQVDVVDAYRNAMPEAAPEQLRHALAGGIDAATFTSSSSATHLQSAAQAAGLTWPFAGVAAISIGPITSATLRDSGWEPAIEAEQSDIPGLIAAVVQLFSRS